MATNYIHGHHKSVIAGHSWRTAENSCPHLLPYLKDNTSLKILDVGCGPGTISIDLASRAPQGFVYAFDVSPEAIEQARKNAEEKGIKNVRFEVGSIFEWAKMEGVKEGEWDVVHAHQVLQHLLDPLSAILSMKKLLKPTTGILALRDVDWAAITWYPSHPGIQKWRDTQIAVYNWLKTHASMGKQLHALALQAGFSRQDIDASVSCWVFSTPEERAYWCHQWAERTLKSDFRENVLESGCATESDLEEIAQAFREMEEKEDGWFAVMNGEVICRVK